LKLRLALPDNFKTEQVSAEALALINVRVCLVQHHAEFSAIARYHGRLWVFLHRTFAHELNAPCRFACVINTAFGLPQDFITALQMVGKGRMPIVEVDDYPPQTSVRPRHAGMLPPGNALVSLAMTNLAACDVAWISPPVRRDGPLYEGRRAGTCIGPAGELLELVEVG
jgi:hypothetical protein